MKRCRDRIQLSKSGARNQPDSRGDGGSSKRAASAEAGAVWTAVVKLFGLPTATGSSWLTLGSGQSIERNIAL